MNWLPRIIGLALLLGGAACSSISTEPWMEAGIQRGTVTKTKTEAGYTYQYEDDEELLRVLEYRSSAGELVEGLCTLRYDYDPEGRQTLARAFDLHDQPTETEDLWSEQHTSFTTTPAGAGLIEHRYTLPGGELVATRPGYAIQTIEYEFDSDRLHRIEYFGTDRNPTCIDYRGVEGVSSVTFAYLKGLQPICMAALRNDSDQIIKRIKISGQTRSVTESNNYEYGYGTYRPYYNP